MVPAPPCGPALWPWPGSGYDHEPGLGRTPWGHLCGSGGRAGAAKCTGTGERRVAVGAPDRHRRRASGSELRLVGQSSLNAPAVASAFGANRCQCGVARQLSHYAKPFISMGVYSGWSSVPSGCSLCHWRW